jgi:glycosyltransferase involved in cell wall biosynthesis
MPSRISSPKVLFFEPPIKHQTGGLRAALESLRTALPMAGIEAFVSSSVPEKPESQTIAHFHGLWQPAHVRRAAGCRALGIPYLVSTHGMLEPWAWRHKRWKKLPYFYFVERQFLIGARYLLATADAEARNLAGFFPNTKIHVIPLGITGNARPDYKAARSNLGWKDDEWVLLFLSRIHEKKGLELLLDALAHLRTSRPLSMRLVIVGGGETRYVRRLKARCAARQRELPEIEWHGEQWGLEKWKYFQGADLFCLPTHSENFGLAVLEACQVGTPALTTTATPWASTLVQGRGYIANPDTESVKTALRTAFEDGKADNARRNSLARWAHATFSWDHLAERYAAVYRETAVGR